jgi:hypothetical protein
MIKAYLTLSLFIYVSLSSYLRSAPFRGYLICDDLGLFISLPPSLPSFFPFISLYHTDAGMTKK